MPQQEAHVHEIVAPAPWPVATAFPPALRTVTAHTAAAERRAVKTTGPPSEPLTVGA